MIKGILSINPHTHLKAAVVVALGSVVISRKAATADTRATAAPLIQPRK